MIARDYEEKVERWCPRGVGEDYNGQRIKFYKDRVTSLLFIRSLSLNFKDYFYLIKSVQCM